MDRPLTIREAAEFLGISTYSVRMYAKTGKLKGYKLGNGANKAPSHHQWRFWRQDLVEFLEQGSTNKEIK